jgi:hypothetical protein
MSQSASANGRDTNGRFAHGNPGGPGRPRRAVEADYLAALRDAVPIERWRKIVERAAADAEAGDAKAGQWLTDNPLGTMPRSLLDLVASELEGTEVIDREVVLRCVDIVDDLTGGALTANLRAAKLKNQSASTDPKP